MRKIMRIRARRTARIVATIATVSAVLLALLAAFMPAGADEGLGDTEGTEDTTPTTEAPVETTTPTTEAPVEDTTPTTEAPVEDPPPTTEAPVDDVVPPPTTAAPQQLSVESFGDVDALRDTGGTITINKSAPSGTFDFRVQQCTASDFVCFVLGGGWTTVATPTIAGGASTGVAVAADDDYRVQELDGPGGSPGAPAGWILTSRSCTGGSDVTAGSRFEIVDNDVTCDFTNVQGSITVTKAAGGGPTQSFDFDVEVCDGFFLGFCTDWDDVAGGLFSLTNDGSSSTVDAGEGRYRIREDIPTGWRLTDAACNVGTSPNIVDIFLSYDGVIFEVSDSAPNVSCTFTNTQNSITVAKASTALGAPDFTVDLEMCDVNVFALCPGWTDVGGSPFALGPGESASYAGFDAPAFNRFFRVLEDDPGSAWTTSAACTGQFGLGSPGAFSPLGYGFLFSLNQNVPAVADCIVTNTLANPASINVGKTVIGADAQFVFDLNGNLSPALGNGGTHTYEQLVPGVTYTLSEQIQPGYSLTARACTGGDPADITLDGNGNAVAITPSPGAAYTCTYTNLQDAAAGLAITKTASAPTANVGDTITYTYAITNTGPVGVVALALTDDKLGPIPLAVTDLLSGQSTTATATYVVQPGDAGTTIVNVASLTGAVPFPVTLANGEVGTNDLAVTATAQASVTVTAVGAAVAELPRGADTSGTLPRTGSSPWSLIRFGIGFLIAGTALGLLFWRRYRGRTLANLQ